MLVRFPATPPRCDEPMSDALNRLSSVVVGSAQLFAEAERLGGISATAPRSLTKQLVNDGKSNY